MSYYSELENWSNLYAIQIGLGGSYGHSFRNTTSKEILRHDGCVVRDGVRGGSDGAIYRRWVELGSDYDDEVARSITFSRWLQIKRVKKLCNNDVCPKKGEEGYDPTYKYDYIYKCIINNVNAISKRAELDATGDETSWSTASPGESGAGVTFRVMNKPGISKGGQTVIVSDSHRVRPRAYMHRHKMHEKPEGWNAMGPIECRKMLEKLIPMVDGEDGETKKLYSNRPHSTWDNHFSGDQMMQWAGENGFGLTMTCRRDRLPKGVEGKYWHKEKTDANRRSKLARFFNPIVAVKTFAADGDKKAYRRVHVSFQSTGPTNISTVNALSSCKLEVQKRERGVRANKRKWAIEWNSGRGLYLGMYSRIDSIDHLIKNCRIKYRSWKYWHSPMLHGMSLAIVTAYDIYLEVAEGKLNPDWKTLPVDFWTFRDGLSKQMLAYDPLQRKYSGDGAMRVCTSQKKRTRSLAYYPEEEEEENLSPVRRRTRGRPSRGSAEKDKLEDQYISAKKGRGENSRLCGDLTRLKKHLNSVTTSIKHQKACKVCGGDAYSMCGICGVYLHCNPSRGKYKGKNCFNDYHDDCFFGLCRDDNHVGKKFKKKEWSYPSSHKTKANLNKLSEYEVEDL